MVLSIPTSLVAAFALLRAGGLPLNIITLAALSIAIGLVVDDSIVVTDNIIRHLDGGRFPRGRRPEGAAEVSQGRSPLRP